MPKRKPPEYTIIYRSGDGKELANDCLRVLELSGDTVQAIAFRDAIDGGTVKVVAELIGTLRRIIAATPHSMCSDAEAWCDAEAFLALTDADPKLLHPGGVPCYTECDSRLDPPQRCDCPAESHRELIRIARAVRG